MFVDEVRIKVVGGRGGNGMVSFRREKFVPFGGPNGGNGGDGGDVILLAENNTDTLSNFRGKKVFKAPDGINGGSQNLTGKRGEPLILHVPPGTIVRDAITQEVLYDFTHNGETFTVTKGGRGGYGNAHFVSSIRQAPKFAELGDHGEEREIMLVLKLIADVGIIGLPNAGKSTLISHISAAKPAIADYPFTTLIPHLGIVVHKGKSFVISDNPGLIAGASKGKGLGIEFLKHIERTRILLHLLDGTSPTIIKDYMTIRKELIKYSKQLAMRHEIVAVNKMDVLSEKDIKKISMAFKKKKIALPFFISAASGKNLQLLLDHLIELLNTLPRSVLEKKETIKIFRPHLTDPHYYEVIKKKNLFLIKGNRIEQLIRMSPEGNKEALERVYDVIKKMGIQKELLRLGAKDGQPLQIGVAKIPFRE